MTTLPHLLNTLLTPAIYSSVSLLLSLSLSVSIRVLYLSSLARKRIASIKPLLNHFCYLSILNTHSLAPNIPL